MAYWLYPANTKYYDVLSAFSKSIAYWPVKTKVAPGDSVLIYMSAPYKQIGFQTEVAQINLEQEKIYHRISPFFKKVPASNNDRRTFMKLINIERIELECDSPLGLEQLRRAGLRGMLMSPRNLDNNPELLDYITGKLK